MFNYPVESLPQKGYVLGYFSSELVFKPYYIENGTLIFDGSDILIRETPREIHFFDDKKEYRLIKREFRKDIIEKYYTSDEEKEIGPDLLFVEEVLVDERFSGPEKLKIINRYEYSQNDTLVLKSYRISLCD